MKKVASILSSYLMRVYNKIFLSKVGFVPIVNPAIILSVDRVAPSWIYDDIFIDECYSAGSERAPESIRRIIDIGSNIGLAALYFLQKYDRATIECFEPNERIFKCLSQNLSAYSSSRIIKHNEAVSDTAGMVDFFEDKRSASALNASITGRDLDGKPQSVIVRTRVKCVSISEIIGQHEYIDLIKIDAEGAEYNILLHPCINPAKVRELVVEFHDIGKNIEQFRSVITALLSRGYRQREEYDIANILAHEDTMDKNTCMVLSFAAM